MPFSLVAASSGSRASGGLDRVGVARLDGSDQVHAADRSRQRSIPHTCSATSLVNAASRWNARGTSRERSEKAIVPPSMRTR